MSDTSQGAGWWLASDGKWYPPETWTGPPPTSGSMPYTGGNPAYQGVAYVPVPVRPTNGMAVASLVCSCAGIIPVFFGITCILGIIFGFVGRGQIKRTNGAQGGDGLALAGIIVGFSLIGIAIILVSVAIAISHGQICTSNSNSFNCSVN